MPRVRETVYEEERSGSGRGKAAHPASKNPPARTPTHTTGSPEWFSTLTPSELASGQELER